MRPSFSDLDRITLSRCEHADPSAAGREGCSVTAGAKVPLSHGTRFQASQSQPRLVVYCDLTGTGAKKPTPPRKP